MFIHDFSKKAMTWTDEHNEVLIREMLLFQPRNQWRKFGRGFPRSYRDWVPPRQGDDRFF